jgi:biopolymer transport protein TolR
MAHIDDGKGNRSANVDVNIVPVIDLMSVLIVFLLITAVWNQISMIQLATSIYGKKSDDQQVQEKKPDDLQIPLRLDIKLDGYVVVFKDKPTRIPNLNGDYDTKGLSLELKRIKGAFPNKTDIIISVEDEISYGSLVKGMDVAITEQFPQVSIATGGAE